ncbi:rod shape-determining protein RodA [Candidatus Albibeggiatoa sp. nov. NOAA]|uniref:rod shape-determining protein RodA n=1 Tax=Candidatus Albibeggiatoa sp. nov. NOAA TaxID=3162724 RepID=UPI0032F44344|nr:rod shape-determining protein RodA [Thiotrichaceae bacterium]
MRITWSNNHFFHLDKSLFLALLILAALGLVVLYSAGGENMSIVMKQGIRFAVGFGILIVLAQIRTENLLPWIPWVYLTGLVLLIAVLFVGDTVNGSQRWLNLGLFRFQPSEIMKLAVPLMVAWYVADKRLPPSYSLIGVVLLIIMVPTVLIAKQPDLGTSLLVASSGMFVLFLAGLSWKLILSAIAASPLIGWALWEFFLHSYQKARILTLLNPEGKSLTTGYHIVQSKIAIGSGGLYGKGWLNGTQSHLEFLPERSTDFIFAVYSEEFGLIGVLVLLGLYAFVLTRGMFIAIQAQGTFARLIAGSLSLTFFVYIFVNMGMVSGFLPVVGVPLPLISYGGTSLVTMMASFGLLMGIHTHKRLLSG